MKMVKMGTVQDIVTLALFSIFLLCLVPSPLLAYFEDSPQSFRQLTFAGAAAAASPASFSGTKLDMVYHLPYRGIDEDFSSYYMNASREGRKLSLAFAHSDFGFDSVYNEQITRLSLGLKMKNNWTAGVALKQFAIKFSPDSYTADDPYFSKTSASAMDADIGAVKKTSKGDISFNISNLLGSGIGLVGSEALNRSISAGWSLPFSVFNRPHLFFAELAVNDSDNFESFDYRTALESRVSSNAVFRMAFDRYYFVPSAEFSYPLEGGYDIGAGFAYRYPYNTFSGFSQFTTLISIKKSPLSEKDRERIKIKELEKAKALSDKKLADKLQRENVKKQIEQSIAEMKKEFNVKNYEKASKISMRILKMDTNNKTAKKILRKIKVARNNDKKLKIKQSGTKPKSKKLNIAVSDFEARAPISQSEAAFIADFFRSELIQTKSMIVVERSNMDKIFAEQGLQQSGCTTSDCAVQMGKILNVQLMVIGSCGKLQDKYVITIKVVNVEDSEIIYSDYDSTEKSDLLGSLCRKMVTKMIAKNIEQLMKGNYFNAAVKHYESGEYEKAIEQWKKVLELDSSHTESKRLIKEVEGRSNESK